MEIELNESFLSEYFKGPELHHAVEQVTNNAQMLAQSQIAKRTGLLASTVRAHVEIGPVIVGEDRWIGTVTVGGEGSAGTADYGASYEFGAGDHAASEALAPEPGKKRGTSAKAGSSGGHHNRAAHILTRVAEELGGL